MNWGLGQNGGVAQSVEHLPFKQVAGGSSPPTLTKFFEDSSKSAVIIIVFLLWGPSIREYL